MHCVRNPHGAHFGDSVLSRGIGPVTRELWEGTKELEAKGVIDPRIPVPTAIYNTARSLAGEPAQ
jgi:hypothetical protein